MERKLQTIKRTVLFLFGVILILCGYKGDLANTQVGTGNKNN